MKPTRESSKFDRRTLLKQTATIALGSSALLTVSATAEFLQVQDVLPPNPSAVFATTTANSRRQTTPMREACWNWDDLDVQVNVKSSQPVVESSSVSTNLSGLCCRHAAKAIKSQFCRNFSLPRKAQISTLAACLWAQTIFRTAGIPMTKRGLRFDPSHESWYPMQLHPAGNLLCRSTRPLGNLGDPSSFYCIDYSAALLRRCGCLSVKISLLILSVRS